MRLARIILILFLVILVTSPHLGSQQSTTTPQRDPQALGILKQAIDSAGGPTSLSTIQDVTASGTVTFHWAGENVQGNATVMCRGIGQFRLDATLPDGARSWRASNGIGSFTDVDGSLQPIPGPSSVELGSMTFPYMIILSALQDNSASISYVGLEATGGTSLHHIRLGLSVPPGLNMLLTTNAARVRDMFIDATSLQIIAMRGNAYLKDNLSINVRHEVHFSNYRTVNGILIPFAVEETVYGQPTLSIQFNQITFNSGLSDSQFQ